MLAGERRAGRSPQPAVYGRGVTVANATGDVVDRAREQDNANDLRASDTDLLAVPVDCLPDLDAFALGAEVASSDVNDLRVRSPMNPDAVVSAADDDPTGRPP